MSTNTTALRERIARALFLHENPDPGISWAETRAFPRLREQYMDAATAVLPIVAVEVRKTKAEAWDEGQHDLYLYYQSEGLAGSEGRNPYRATEYETGDSDEHR